MAVRRVISPRTSLADLTDRAATLLRELSRYPDPGSAKMSAAGFHRQALERAQTTDKKLDRLGKELVKNETGTEQIASFIRIIWREIQRANYPGLPRDLGQLVNAFGHEALTAQCAAHGFRAEEAVAFAVRQAARERPESFGVVPDYDAHITWFRVTEQKLAQLYEQMRCGWTATDVQIDTSSLTPAERNARLVRVTFVTHPDLNLMEPNWPELMVQRRVNEIENELQDLRESDEAEDQAQLPASVAA